MSSKVPMAVVAEKTRAAAKTSGLFQNCGSQQIQGSYRRQTPRLRSGLDGGNAPSRCSTETDSKPARPRSGERSYNTLEVFFDFFAGNGRFIWV